MADPISEYVKSGSGVHSVGLLAVGVLSTLQSAQANTPLKIATVLFNIMRHSKLEKAALNCGSNAGLIKTESLVLLTTTTMTPTTTTTIRQRQLRQQQ